LSNGLNRVALIFHLFGKLADVIQIVADLRMIVVDIYV
jgi:hypothetical protein